MRAAGRVVTITGAAGMAVAVALYWLFGPYSALVAGAYAGAGLLIGGSLIAGGRPESRQAAATARLIATGAAGTGTVTALQRTSTGNEASPNCRIRLNISLPDRAVYQAVVTQAILQTAMPRYQPGRVFAVRVDPDDLAAVAIVDLTEATYAASPALLHSGLAGSAKVTEVFEPSFADHRDPEWRLALRVQAGDGRPAYDVRLVTGYPARTSRPRRGDQLAVLISPEDPRLVAVEWPSRGVHMAGQRSTGRRRRG